MTFLLGLLLCASLMQEIQLEPSQLFVPLATSQLDHRSTYSYLSQLEEPESLLPLLGRLHLDCAQGKQSKSLS